MKPYTTKFIARMSRRKATATLSPNGTYHRVVLLTRGELGQWTIEQVTNDLRITDAIKRADDWVLEGKR